MIRRLSPPAAEIDTLAHPRAALLARLPALAGFVRDSAALVPLSQHPAWLNVLQRALGHEVYAIEATSDGQTHGFLPLAFVSSILFGRFLVSLPYLNTNGVVAASPDVQSRLVSHAIKLADELGVRYLELRHERPVDHPDLNARLDSKVHMRLALPRTADKLWKGFDPKVRNQLRKGERAGFAVTWGTAELLDPFFDVLSRNMRDLGTPVYGKRLFREMLAVFAGDAEICLVRDGAVPVAGALLLHGKGVTEVPTASSLKQYNSSCVNMLMYWHLLQRSLAREQQVFDFGRSSVGGNTYGFKKQWGAIPHPAIWQYHVRHGTVGEMRPDNPRYLHAIRLWQRLPLRLTQVLGPVIVRGIP
ncbi:MAG TPA: FemAB family XrtA/PEP-CTERM system-associated protein [Gemmataceae bacterium]|nr:FemAB family XrtA/PEP-CTERM system-associated protein [Gemmataceae bacterium]